MLRTLLKSKIHRARITDKDLSYEGSLTVDRTLMDAADLRPFEQVMIYNISNGERFETYLIEGPPGSGAICLNGAAARKGEVGDLIIIASYGLYGGDEIEAGSSIAVYVDETNRISSIQTHPWKRA
ncbi:MAG: aspartate 1-decarboxylase [Deltaproteobacteria bacterium]